MTRVLYWNIENFGYNKIRPLTTKRNLAGALIPDLDAADRLALILAHITAFNPDIFVVVETSSGPSNGPGSLISPTGGWQGCVELLLRIRNLTGVAWNLVPPLVVGQAGRAEGVAVFYKPVIPAGGGVAAGRRLFTGPNAWSPAGNGISFNPNVAPAPAAGNYPALQANACFTVANRAIPATALNPGNLNESRCAARVDFVDNAGAPINYGGLREPYMVTFCETVDGPPVVVQRNLTLFAIHSPPQYVAANAYLNGLANVRDISAALGALETRVITGDFNVNLLSQVGNDPLRYAALTALGYGLQLQPPAVAPPPALEAYTGYFATHLRSLNSTIFWSTNAGAVPYPGYRYIGSSNSSSLYSIDNILVRGGAAANFTVANTVVGTPMNAVNPAPGGAPMGQVAIACDFQMPPANWTPAPPAPPLPLVPPDPAPAFAFGDRQRFRDWRNMGHIRSTSDHLALFVTV
ncbi:endonuclease/exonuclease/phosphatase family protein [Pseudomonas chlororaphis]|uniref:Endonuclease/exonuclease/phosphatase domain-containing protein n=1 Tax=Pseudomonas chlororaphis TaxID=587753 RepID=A0A1Q8ERB5_9PSED|nr:endonuclease/exonuclease/phosphatase family protein [Pseudomonas chlororaphis]OLF54323.1 hypothetical protein BTN82_14865 [Pseudomonas chlororaphis]